MTTNVECAIAVLASHRDARKWTDEAVALDLLAQLGLDPQGEAAHPAPVVDPAISEDEVIAAEAQAQEAVDKAKAAREALNKQNADQTGTGQAANQANPEAGQEGDQSEADEAGASGTGSRSARSRRGGA